MRGPWSRLTLLVLGIGLLACSGLGGKDGEEEEEVEEEEEEDEAGETSGDSLAEGCALASGLWDLEPTLVYDTCDAPEEDIERSWSVEIDCYDEDGGRFTFHGFLSEEPVECQSDGDDFTCAGSGEVESAATGTAGGSTAVGEWALVGECELAGSFEMTL